MPSSVTQRLGRRFSFHWTQPKLRALPLPFLFFSDAKFFTPFPGCPAKSTRFDADFLRLPTGLAEIPQLAKINDLAPPEPEQVELRCISIQECARLI
jgi:hypothetical protein